MLISFDNMQETVVPHARGGEKELYRKCVELPDNTVMLGRLEPGASLGVHAHEDSSETVYYLAGKGRMYFDGRYEPAEAGKCHHCPKGHSHGLENTGDEDLVFFAVIPKQ